MTEIIDFPMGDKFNAIGGTLVVIASYIFGAHWKLFGAFLALNVADYITGVMKSKLQSKESSSSGLRGIIKKLSYWVMIVLAFLLGDVLNQVGHALGTDFSSFAPAIGWYTLATLGLNELRSILENLVECEIPVPPFLIKGLKVASKILQKQEELFDGAINLEGTDSEDGTYPVELKTPADELKEKGVVTLRIQTIDTNDAK